jgi:hypothetical protein
LPNGNLSIPLGFPLALNLDFQLPNSCAISISADSDVRLRVKNELFHKLFNTTVEKCLGDYRRDASSIAC